jgi:hypothetical protein
MNIYVNERSVYGNTMIYPACDKAKVFANIAGTKTLTFETVQQIKNLGYDVCLNYRDKL